MRLETENKLSINGWGGNIVRSFYSQESPILILLHLDYINWDCFDSVGNLVHLLYIFAPFGD